MGKTGYRLIALAVLLALGAAPQAPVHAQGALDVRVYPVETSNFPTITGLLDVFDSSGQFVPGLSAGEVTLLENGLAVPEASLEERQQGLDLVVAVNPGPAMAVRDGLGVTRLDRVNAALKTWISSRPADSEDTLSLVSTLGIVSTRSSSAGWLAAYESYELNAREAAPSLQSLSLAIGIFENTPAAAHIKRAILFITPHIDGANLDTLQGLIIRAGQAGVRVFVWSLDSEAYLQHSSLAGLRAMTEQTSGGYFAFTGSEPIPDPEAYFADLRQVYAFTYESTIRAGGTQRLSAEVRFGESQGLSPEYSFDLDVQPPNPMLLSPPLQIVRQVPEGQTDPAMLAPMEQTVTILVEFPDGFARPLARTALFVDGEAVAENSTAPFDRFVWDLSGYTISGQHFLSVEAVDTLGLSRTSMGVPVTVTVVQPPTGVQTFFSQFRQQVVTAAVVLAGLTLALMFVIGLRSRLPSLRQRRAEQKRRTDPVTQPVQVSVDPGLQRPGASGLGWFRRTRTVSAPAYLVSLGAEGGPGTASPIPLAGKEITIGTDPTQSLVVLDDPSVSMLHARLRHDDHGNYWILDHNSTAGTWVNYTPVTREGCALHHGDSVHFGKVSYRFVLRKPPAQPEPRITRLEK